MKVDSNLIRLSLDPKESTQGIFTVKVQGKTYDTSAGRRMIDSLLIAVEAPSKIDADAIDISLSSNGTKAILSLVPRRQNT